MVRWAGERRDIRAVALVGSWARGTPRPDSDVDLVILSTQPDLYLTDDEWGNELGVAGFIDLKRWGALTERRAITTAGIEVEFGISTSQWASVDPVDEGTRRVVQEGIRILYDPDELLDRLVRAAR